MPEFQDRALKCVDCGTEFIFTAGEQQFYHEKDFRNEPKRCKACKTRRQNNPSDRGVPSGRVETSAICSQCGRETTVPSGPRRAGRSFAGNASRAAERRERPRDNPIRPSSSTKPPFEAIRAPFCARTDISVLPRLTYGSERTIHRAPAPEASVQGSLPRRAQLCGC